MVLKHKTTINVTDAEADTQLFFAVLKEVYRKDW